MSRAAGLFFQGFLSAGWVMRPLKGLPGFLGAFTAMSFPGPGGPAWPLSWTQGMAVASGVFEEM